MNAELYNGYSIWGPAILLGLGYAASGTITRSHKLVETSGVLGSFGTEDEAELIGLNWCRAWVNSHD